MVLLAKELDRRECVVSEVIRRRCLQRTLRSC
jgi:hypothetical protein